VAKQRAFFARQPRLLYGCGLIPSVWLGRERSFDEQGMRLIKRMGGSHFGMNISWPDVEPSPEQWRFDYTDWLVRAGRDQGLEPFVVMGFTPNWALPEEAKGRRRINHRYPPADEYEEAFINYCDTVAERYRGKIKYYQFWNEPNGCSWVNDGCRNSDSYPLYTRWLKTWYTAMKSKDPDCVLAAGRIDYHEGVTEGYKYLEGMYREGAGDYFDAFCIHPYHKHGGTLHHQAIRDTRRVMVENGDWDKGIWVTEYGWDMDDESHKARLLQQTLTELTNPAYFYVTAAVYLSLTDPPGEKGYGLCEEDLRPRPSYETFKMFIARHSRRSRK